MSNSNTSPGETPLDPSKIPLASPPPGVTPNFINPESRAWQTYLTASLCLALAFTFMSLRICSKALVIKKFTIDDYTMIFAFACFCTYCGLAIAVSKTGYDHHMWDLTLLSITSQAQLLFLVANCFYGFAISIIKLALFLLIYHIFRRLKWLRYLVRFGASISLLFYFSGSIYLTVICSPLHGLNYAELARTPRCCQHAITYGYVQGVVNIVSDFYLLIIPIPAVWSLQMPKRKKIGIMAILMTGLLACGTSCVSMWTRIVLEDSTDITWDSAIPLLVAMTEMAIGIVVGCTPAVAAIYHQKHSSFARFFAVVWRKFNLSRLSSVFSSKDKKVSGQSSHHDSLRWRSESYVELTEGARSKTAQEDPKRPIEDVTLSRW